MNMNVVCQDVKAIEADAVIVGFYEDVRPLKGAAGELDWLLCGTLSSLIIDRRLRGAVGEVALVTSREKIPAGKIFLLGFGPRARCSAASLKQAARTAAATAAGAGITSAAIELFAAFDPTDQSHLASLRDGLREGAGNRPLSISIAASGQERCDLISRFIAA